MARQERLVYPYYKPNAVLLFRIIEMTSFCFIIVCVCIYIRILTRRQFCHSNLLFLLITQPICHTLSIFFRSLRLLTDMLGLLNQTGLTAIDFSCDTMISTCFQVVLGYSIERSIALKYWDTYDTMYARGPTLGIGLLLGSFIYSAILMYLYYNAMFPSEVAYASQIVLFAGAIFVFYRLRTISTEAYQRVAETKNATVNQRFETARNLKAAQLLLHLAPYKCVTNFISLFLYYWIFEIRDPYYMPYYSFMYFMANHTQLFFQMMLTIYSHSTLRSEFLKFFGVNVSEEPESLRNILGKKMIFTVNESNEVYFKQMSSMWDLPLPVSKTPKNRYTI